MTGALRQVQNTLPQSARRGPSLLPVAFGATCARIVAQKHVHVLKQLPHARILRQDLMRLSRRVVEMLRIEGAGRDRPPQRQRTRGMTYEP